MAKQNGTLETRIHPLVSAIVANAVKDALEAFRQEILSEIGRTQGAPFDRPAAAPSRTKAAAARPTTAKGRGKASGKGTRDWPSCSVPGCTNKFFGPSGSARFCYQHYLQSGGQHPANGARASSATAAPKAAKTPRGKSAGGDVEQLLAFIGKNPGLRSEQIQQQIGIKPAAVKAGLAKLRTSTRVKTQGTRRATRYTAA